MYAEFVLRINGQPVATIRSFTSLTSETITKDFSEVVNIAAYLQEGSNTLEVRATVGEEVRERTVEGGQPTIKTRLVPLGSTTRTMNVTMVRLSRTPV
jgi:hypothetical protein